MDGGGNDCGLGIFKCIKNEIHVLHKETDGSIGQVWSKTRQFWSKAEQGLIGTEGVLMGASPYGER